jgi:hypothetical protein
VEIGSAGLYGVWIRSADLDGVRVDSADDYGGYFVGSDGGVYGSSATNSGHGGYFTNTCTIGSGGVGLFGGSVNPLGIGVLGENDANMYSTIGVKGSALAGTGVYGVGGYTGVYGEGPVGVEGKATEAGTGVSGRSDSGVGGHFRSTSGTAVQADGDVQINGDLTVSGQVSGFPRPNFDSSWVSVAAGGTVTINHNLGGDPYDYVVDMTFRDNVWGSGLHQITYGGDWRPGPENKGVWWENLTSTTIKVLRMAQDVRCQEVRIRIWVYK